MKNDGMTSRKLLLKKTSVRFLSGNELREIIGGLRSENPTGGVSGGGGGNTTCRAIVR